MLAKLFGRSKPAPDPEPSAQLCMPALASAQGLNETSIAAAWRELFPGEPLTFTGKEKSVLSFDVGEVSLMLVGTPIPIPKPDIDHACAASWMWTDAADEMRRQKAHVVIGAFNGDRTRRGALNEALAVSRLAAAVCKAGDVVGVYWGNGGHIHKPAFFIDAIKDLNQGPPLGMLWVGLRISSDSPRGPFTLTTQGLNPFGHKELEIVDTKMGIGDLRMTAWNLIAYLLESGPVIKHGQTFGPDPHTHWKVEHVESRFRKGEAVMRLHLP